MKDPIYEKMRRRRKWYNIGIAICDVVAFIIWLWFISQAIRPEFFEGLWIPLPVTIFCILSYVAVILYSVGNDFLNFLEAIMRAKEEKPKQGR